VVRPTQACWHAATYYKACEVNIKIMKVSPAAAAASVDFVKMPQSQQPCRLCEPCSSKEWHWLGPTICPCSSFSMVQLQLSGRTASQVKIQDIMQRYAISAGNLVDGTLQAANAKWQPTVLVAQSVLLLLGC